MINENLMKGLEEYRAKVASGEIEVVRLNPLQRAEQNPTSLRYAINAMCYDCMGREGQEKNASSIRNCTAKKCPLYPCTSIQVRS